MEPPIVRLSGVTRRYMVGTQPIDAVACVDLEMEAGEYISIMGASGSGKSTLLNLIALLDRPNAGRYEFSGVDVTTLEDDALAAIRRESIGFVFQFFNLVARLSAGDNVALPMVLAGIPPAERARGVSETLSRVGLSDRAAHRPGELSGGQRQRVAIARAIVRRPPLVLCDEPTGNLDSASGDQVVELLEALHEEQGSTLVVVTHDPALGRRAGRRLRMRDGHIESDSRGGGAGVGQGAEPYGTRPR